MPSEWLDRKPASHFHIEADDRICKLPELREFGSVSSRHPSIPPSPAAKGQRTTLCTVACAGTPETYGSGRGRGARGTSPACFGSGRPDQCRVSVLRTFPVFSLAHNLAVHRDREIYFDAAQGWAKNGAEAGTRTPTPLRALDPESSASANSATSARNVFNELRRTGRLSRV